MKVYILQEYIDSHNCGVETNILKVLDSKEKACQQLTEIFKGFADDDFFMDYMLEEDYELTDCDVREITDHSVSLYCDGNGDTYNLYIVEKEVE